MNSTLARRPPPPAPHRRTPLAGPPSRVCAPRRLEKSFRGMGYMLDVCVCVQCVVMFNIWATLHALPYT